MQEFPSEESIALLKRFGVKYVIIHAKRFGRERWLSMEERLSSLPHVISFGTDHVYEP
jgi:hypothetical protein